MKVIQWKLIDGHPLVDVMIGGVTYLDCETDGESVRVRGVWFNLALHTSAG